MKARSLVLASAVFFFATSAAFAQAPSSEARARAKEAYDRGVDAHGKGDMARAAQEFARADSLAPSPVALQAALDAAIEADDPAIGSDLLERSAREKPSGQLAASVNQARAKFAGRAGRVRIACPSGSTCMATLDGAAMETSKPAWARTGQHTVVIQVDGEPQTKLVRVEADQVVEVVGTKKDGASPAPPPPPNDQPAEGGHKKGRFEDGLPPVFFYGGVGLTIVFLGATTYFAIQTSNKHDEFDNIGCARANLTDCEDLKRDGESSQSTTNAGIVLTGIAAAATVVVGVAFTNWKSPMFGMAPLPGGGGAATFAKRF
jgi:hypothetical protein